MQASLVKWVARRKDRVEQLLVNVHGTYEKDEGVSLMPQNRNVTLQLVSSSGGDAAWRRGRVAFGMRCTRALWVGLWVGWDGV